MRIFQETLKEGLFYLMADADAACKEAYYTGNMRPTLISKSEPKTKVTLEFRQHEGTVDGARTISWVQTVVGLFEFADDCDKVFMVAFVMEHAELEDGGKKLYEIEDLLRDIGLEELADFYVN